jgi:hypothetical protein
MDLLEVVLAASQRRDRSEPAVGEGQARHPQQGGVRTYFKEPVHACLAQGPDRIREADGRTHLSTPAGGIGGGPVGHQPPRHVGHERNPGRGELDLAHGVLEPVQDGLHQGGVECVRNVQRAVSNSLLFEAIEHGPDVGGSSRDHRIAGAVDGRDRNRVAETVDRHGDPLFLGERDGHGAGFGQLGHEATPARDEHEGVVAVDDPCDDGGHILSQAVSHDMGRLDPQ